jgi:hypothetical protein
MPTTAQLNANRANAQKSTGPTTDAGKAVSSRNRLTLGLFTRRDYVTFEEQDLYTEFCDTMYLELSPEGLVEEAFATEIAGATWRLRRCSNAEYELGSRQEISEDGTASPYRHDEWPQSAASRRDPLLDGLSEKALRSIDRARASAFSMVNRSIGQLRKLQTERSIRFELSDEQGGIALPSLADSKKVAAARRNQERTAAEPTQPSPAQPSPNDLSMAQIMALCEPPPEIYRAIDAALEKCRLKEEAEKAEAEAAGKAAEAEDAEVQALNERAEQLELRRAALAKMASNCSPETIAEAQRILDEQTAQFQADLAAFCRVELPTEDLAGEKAA